MPHLNAPAAGPGTLRVAPGAGSSQRRCRMMLLAGNDGGASAHNGSAWRTARGLSSGGVRSVQAPDGVAADDAAVRNAGVLACTRNVAKLGTNEFRQSPESRLSSPAIFVKRGANAANAASSGCDSAWRAGSIHTARMGAEYRPRSGGPVGKATASRCDVPPNSIRLGTT